MTNRTLQNNSVKDLPDEAARLAELRNRVLQRRHRLNPTMAVLLAEMVFSTAPTWRRASY